MTVSGPGGEEEEEARRRGVRTDALGQRCARVSRVSFSNRSRVGKPPEVAEGDPYSKGSLGLDNSARGGLWGLQFAQARTNRLNSFTSRKIHASKEGTGC